MSLKSLKLIRGVLSLILAEFPEKKQLCGQIRLKSEKPVSPVHSFLTQQQAANILQLFSNDILYPCVYFSLVFGLRRSEVLGLKWEAVTDTTFTVSSVVVHMLSTERKAIRN